MATLSPKYKNKKKIIIIFYYYSGAGMQSLMAILEVFDFSKRIMKILSCLNLFTSINTKQVTFQLAVEIVSKSFNYLEANKQEELYESFPRELQPQNLDVHTHQTPLFAHKYYQAFCTSSLISTV